MKAKTIQTIREMLKRWNEVASEDYAKYDKKLTQKYGADYILFYDEAEEQTLNYKVNYFRDSQEVLNDFENHIWH